MDFNWKQAIEHNKRDLAMIVVELWAMVGRWSAEGRREVEAYRAAFRRGEFASPLRGGARSERSEADRVGVVVQAVPFEPVSSDEVPNCLPPPSSASLRSPVADLPSRGRLEKVFLPPPVYRMARKILRPAEAALRRLIVVVAAVLQFKLEERRAKRDGRPLPDFSTFIKREILPAFNLIDPRKSFGEDPPPVFNGPTPRIWALGINEPDYPNTRVEDVDAALIIRRIRVLEHALNTLPRQAKRLARLMDKRRNNQPGRGRVGPIRPGKPPGNRNRHIHAVDSILDECHWLAREVVAKPP